MSINLNVEDEDLCYVIDAKPLKVQKDKRKSVLNGAH
jgi:hypothetical protein